ncbi:MAG: hypothetical protein AB1695_13475 [Stygiobacter sp.]
MIEVIVTVGTSLITNYLKKDNSIRSQYEILIDQPYSNWKEYSAEINKIKSDLNKVLKNSDLSAEIKTLVKLKDDLNQNLQVYLFCTDTILSKLAADIIKEKYDDEFEFKEIKIIEGLQTSDFQKYDSTGYLRLISSFKQIVLKDSHGNKSVYLAISGGYKAIIPPLTILGQLYNTQLVYVYEESDDLIYFPSLPVHFDWSLAEQFYPYLQDIAKGKKINDNGVIEEMKELRVIRKSNERYKITPLGELFKEYIDSELPLADNTLGFFVEYKLMEYFLINPYQNRFKSVVHSKKIEFNGNHREIDLILKDDIKNEIVVIESKSLLQVSREKDFEKLKNQIEAQLNILVNGKFPVTEYHLSIHHTHFFNFESIKTNLIELKKLVEQKNSEILFKVYSLKININLRNRNYYNNPYQKFLALPIKLEEIKIN